MPSYLLVVIWLVIILAEAAYNWYLIERRHVRIKHGLRTFYRILVGGLFWIAGPIACHTLEQYQWWLMPTLMAMLFWAVFDPALNWMRGRYLCYLGSNFLDRLQKQHGGEQLWFFVKLASAVQVVIIFLWKL